MCCLTHGGGIIRKRQRVKQTVFVPGEWNVGDTSIALLLSRVDRDTSVYNQFKTAAYRASIEVTRTTLAWLISTLAEETVH